MPTVDDLILRVRTVGAKVAGEEIAGVESTTGRLGKTAKSVAGVAGLAGLAFGLKDITSQAIKWQNQQGQLASTMKNMGIYTQENMKRVTQAADTLAQHGGFDPATNISGIQRLIGAHVKLSQAIKDQNLVTDISRKGHIAYTAAQRAVMMVEQGRTTGLARLGIVIKPVTAAVDALATSHKKLTPEMRRAAKDQDAQATKLVALRELWKRFGGATQAYSKSAAGAASNLKNQMEILTTSLGVHLLPAITAVLNWLNKAVTYFEHNKTAATALGVALAALATAWIALKAASAISAIAANPMVLVLMAVAAAAYLVVTHWKQIKAAAIDVYNWVKSNWPLVAGILYVLLGPIGLVIAAIILIATHFKQVKAVVMDVVHWFVGAFNTIKHIIGDVVNWIKGHWVLLLTIMLGPLGLVLAWVIKHLPQILSVFKTVWGGIKTVVSTVWGIIRPIFDLLFTVLGKVWGAVKVLGDIFKTVFSAIASVVSWTYNNVLKPVFDAVNTGLNLINKAAGAVSNLNPANLFNTTTHPKGSIAPGAAPLTFSGPPAIGHRAGGGGINEPGYYDVGERGRERLYLPRGAYVQSNAESRVADTSQTQPLENHVYLQIGHIPFGKAVAYSLAKAKAVS